MTAILAASALLASCNSGSGFVKLPSVTPAQTATVSAKVPATEYFVELHPADAPSLAVLRTLHNQWHASGIRMDYVGSEDAFYDVLVANALSAGLKLVLTTPYTNRNPDVTTYAQTVGLAAQRYAGHGIIWEIYNEPDLNFAGKGGTGVAGYIALAMPTAIAIRANDPTAVILTGGTSGKDSDFSFAITAGQALAKYVDGVAIHPYDVDYASMGAAAVDVSLATGKPVYETEWSSSGGQGLSEAMSSARGLTPLFCAYEYQEQATETAGHQPVWGLLNSGAWTVFAATAQ